MRGSPFRHNPPHGYLEGRSCPIGKYPDRLPTRDSFKVFGKCYRHSNIDAIAICEGKPVCYNCMCNMAAETQRRQALSKEGK